MRRLLPLLLAALTAFPAAAAAAALAYQRHQLRNGLVVLLYKDDSAPLVAVNVWYKVGSKNEQPGRTGFAHLFEHYMFECSKNTTQGQYFDTVFKRLGGIANAYTSFDKTNYYSVVPTNGLDEMLRLESDRMGFLLACLNQQSLDKQRGIVQNEKRERSGQPYGTFYEKMIGQTFWSPHPYGWPVIGSMQDLEAASLRDVAAFHGAYYLPNNAVISVAGAIDQAKTLERIRFWFEGLKAGPAAPAAAAAPIESLGGRRETSYVDQLVQEPMLVMAFPVPARGKPGSDAAATLAQVLGGGRGARLTRALRENAQPLAVSVDAEVWGLYETDLLVISAIPTRGTTLPQLEEAILAQLARVAADGPTDRELARVKARMKTAFYNALQNVEGVAESLAEGEAVAKDPGFFLEGEAERLNAVDAEAVKAIARRLTSDNSSIVKVLPPAKPEAR